MFQLALYARTVRYLTWRQLAYRVIRRIQRRVPPRAHQYSGLSGERQSQISPVIIGWGPGDIARRIGTANDVCDGTFTFLNITRTLPSIDWSTRYESHLWSYNLHYFGYAVDLAWAFRETADQRYVSRFSELALDWVTATHGGRGDGWEPYPTSMRIVNWSYALTLFGSSLDEATRARVVSSLYDQLLFLRTRLERDVVGNHLQKNLAAVVIASLMFDGKKERKITRETQKDLWHELQAQVLSDGGHFERTPTYHAIVLVDFLECAQLLRACGEALPGHVEPSLKKMGGAYRILSRPDGGLHLFNDSARGIAPDKGRVEQLLAAVTGDTPFVPDGAFELPVTGYYGYSDVRSGERILIDCGPPAAPNQPGHAHCDALSFELDLRGEPVIVDSGVCGYEGDPFREYVRSTRAHNTLIINDKEQSELWGTFRLARRITGIRGNQTTNLGVYSFSGQYTPYHDKSIVHNRTIRREVDSWHITDRVSGPRVQSVTGFIHFHPDFAVTVSGDVLIADSGRQRVTVKVFGAARIALVRGARHPAQGYWCPEFGRAVPNHVAVLTINNQLESFGYRIQSA